MSKRKPEPFTWVEVSLTLFGCWIVLGLDTMGFYLLTGDWRDPQ